MPDQNTENMIEVNATDAGSIHIDGADLSPWRRRFETIYKTVQRRILLLDYPPGTRLDIEALAAEFEVSRTPIRTVIQRLETEGLAVTRHGVGTAVTEIDFDHVSDAMQLRMHLAELIGTLAPKPARTAIVDLLDKLKDNCDSLGRAEYRQFAHIDVKLHDFKCSLIGNDLLHRTYDEMYCRAVRSWFYYLPKMDWDAEYHALRDDIEMTAAAVRRNDVIAVGFITRNAISSGLHRLNELIARGGIHGV